MKFNILTIFPEVFDPYLNASIMKRAREKGLVDFNIVDLRDFTDDKRRTVDDAPFGGGAGMIMKISPIYEAIKQLRITNYELRNKETKKQRNKETSISKNHNFTQKTKIILLSAKGKRFNQDKAYELSRMDNVALICGRYEGVDERVAEHIADEEISIGDYVLTGGEIPAMAVADAVTRLIPGAISEESLQEESFSVDAVKAAHKLSLQTADDISKFKNKKTEIDYCELKIENCLEYPQYTRPAVFKTDEGEEWKVPEILLSGNHEEIRKWREKQKKLK